MMSAAGLAVAVLNETQVADAEREPDLPRLETSSIDAPRFSLFPICGSDLETQFGLVAAIDGEVVEWRAPGAKGLGDWWITFAGARSCCDADGDGEPPETKVGLFATAQRSP